MLFIYLFNVPFSISLFPNSVGITVWFFCLFFPWTAFFLLVLWSFLATFQFKHLIWAHWKVRWSWRSAVFLTGVTWSIKCVFTGLNIIPRVYSTNYRYEGRIFFAEYLGEELVYFSPLYCTTPTLLSFGVFGFSGWRQVLPFLFKLSLGSWWEPAPAATNWLRTSNHICIFNLNVSVDKVQNRFIFLFFTSWRKNLTSSVLKFGARFLGLEPWFIWEFRFIDILESCALISVGIVNIWQDLTIG